MTKLLLSILLVIMLVEMTCGHFIVTRRRSAREQKLKEVLANQLRNKDAKYLLKDAVDDANDELGRIREELATLAELASRDIKKDLDDSDEYSRSLKRRSAYFARIKSRDSA